VPFPKSEYYFLSCPRKGLLKKPRLLRHYIPRNDAKFVFMSLRAIRRIARQSQNVPFELWQQARKRESRKIQSLGSGSKPALSKQKLALSVAEWAEWVRNDMAKMLT